ncbi:MULTISPECIES: hypothetical protein [unclassified Amycolatopsis]|uniref:hypothetical protein n=1 Tax=unclassified Amycolatopsis TaxID=2618356 RepID=UPI002875F27B|nr:MULTISPECIES: hypothetical protein [unclassified Amycolatopsis]MDS0133382.1 hypothetical protein [Amycolatopsis sp. 505]MDS0146612.1 hypothetical protein [Amycolatopsis sp. CM201R]
MNKKLVGSAVVGVAVLAVVAAQFLGGGDDAPAAAPAPPPSTPASAIVQGSLEVYRFPDAAGGRGWSIEIPVPAGWAVTRENDRASYRSGQLLLETDKVPITQEDALSGLEAVAAKAHQDSSVVKPAQAGDIPDAAEWDYTYLRDGHPERAAVIGVGAGDSLVTIRYEAPPAEFDRNRGVLDAAMKVSAPG